MLSITFEFWGWVTMGNVSRELSLSHPQRAFPPTFYTLTALQCSLLGPVYKQ